MTNTLDLICEQQELFDSLYALNKPIIVYLMNGRPLSINNIHQKANAVTEGWYMGQETGTAAANILFGDANPSGKLSITFPKSVGQLPVYYNHKPTAQYHDYLSENINPLYHFGYGLSYTNFKIGDPVLSKNKITPNESASINIDIENTGNKEGAEVVQLYIRDKVSSVTRPVKELKGFKKVLLKPGEKKNISFNIMPEQLAFYNIEMNFIVEPGEFEIMVWNSSRDEDLNTIILSVV
ncbi:glycoside hydrolase family 3 C-terminal domain-containing protein [Bacteroidota bacterium]